MVVPILGCLEERIVFSTSCAQGLHLYLLYLHDCLRGRLRDHTSVVFSIEQFICLAGTALISLLFQYVGEL